MIRIPIGDWLLARSEAFKVLVEKFREHKLATKHSFTRVKARHYDYDKKINELRARVAEVESLLQGVNEVQVFKIKRKKTK